MIRLRIGSSRCIHHSLRLGPIPLFETRSCLPHNRDRSSHLADPQTAFQGQCRSRDRPPRGHRHTHKRYTPTFPRLPPACRYRTMRSAAQKIGTNCSEPPHPGGWLRSRGQSPHTVRSILGNLQDLYVARKASVVHYYRLTPDKDTANQSSSQLDPKRCPSFFSPGAKDSFGTDQSTIGPCLSSLGTSVTVDTGFVNTREGREKGCLEGELVVYCGHAFG